MLDNTTVARPYAQAVFEQAGEEGNMEEWSSLLQKMTLLVQDPQMRFILHNPRISDSRLLELVTGVIGKPSKTAMNFIRVLIDADRLGHAPYIAALFEEKRAEAEGRVDIRVISAYELDPAQTGRISDAMGKKLGKNTSVSTVIDKSLIGGVVIRAGDSVIDASIRGRLDELRNDLIG